MPDDLDPIWQRWRYRRLPVRGIHLDTAAAGRSSEATINAIGDHLRLEARVGAYVAQETAAPTLNRLRSDLAGLLGMTADGVAFVESATAALQRLLAAWPLTAGGVVAVAPSEWAPNVAALEAAGFTVDYLAVDEADRIDVPHLARRLADDPPALVHLTHVAAHRGLVHPAQQIAAACRDAGVPVWVDAAQSLGHVDAVTGADAVYATGRKWLCGPRGVGVLAVDERWWPRLRVRHHVLAPSDEPTVRALESDDANVAGRIGLACAVRELLDDGPKAVFARLAAVGAQTRAALGGLRGWAVEPATDTAITALRPTAGQYVAYVRARLQQEYGILTTASQPVRAPRDMSDATLRISPHVDFTSVQRETLRAALFTEG